MAKDINKAEYYAVYSGLFTDKQRETMEMYYYSDLSLGEISEETGVTRQAAFNCIKKCEDRLAEFEDSLGLVEKKDKAAKLVASLEELVIKGRKDNALIIIEKLKEIY